MIMIIAVLIQIEPVFSGRAKVILTVIIRTIYQNQLHDDEKHTKRNSQLCCIS